MEEEVIEVVKQDVEAVEEEIVWAEKEVESVAGETTFLLNYINRKIVFYSSKQSEIAEFE